MILEQVLHLRPSLDPGVHGIGVDAAAREQGIDRQIWAWRRRVMPMWRTTSVAVHPAQGEG
jgi:hypothetical protein